MSIHCTQWKQGLERVGGGEDVGGPCCGDPACPSSSSLQHPGPYASQPSGSPRCECSSGFYSWTLSKVIPSWADEMVQYIKAAYEPEDMSSDTQSPLKKQNTVP